MDTTLDGYLMQLKSVMQDLPGVAGRLSHAQFNWQPAPDRWSIGQAVEHLNLTTERYVPLLTKAASEARAVGRTATGPFALGLFERWFLGALEPPPRRRFRTRRAFIAPGQLSPAATLERFMSLHEDFAGCVRAADGLDLARIKVRSQFAPVSWSLNGTLAALLAHERRHIWLAREVRNDPAFPAV